MAKRRGKAKRRTLTAKQRARRAEIRRLNAGAKGRGTYQTITVRRDKYGQYKSKPATGRYAGVKARQRKRTAARW